MILTRQNGLYSPTSISRCYVKSFVLFGLRCVAMTTMRRRNTRYRSNGAGNLRHLQNPQLLHLCQAVAAPHYDKAVQLHASLPVLSASLSINIASESANGTELHSHGPSACRSAKCIVAKRLIGPGCHLGW